MVMSKERAKALKLFYSKLNHLSEEVDKKEVEGKTVRRFKGSREYFWLSDNGMKLFISEGEKLVELI